MPLRIVLVRHGLSSFNIEHRIQGRDDLAALTAEGGEQARATGRALVDGAEKIRLWGEEIRVGATIHTIGGLSAHADQDELINWYNGFANAPPLYLVHGEPDSQEALQAKLQQALPGRQIKIAQRGKRVTL